MSVMNNTVVNCVFPLKVHDYLLTLMSESKVEWKNAQIHSMAIDGLIGGDVISPQTPQIPQNTEPIAKKNKNN